MNFFLLSDRLLNGLTVGLPDVPPDVRSRGSSTKSLSRNTFFKKTLLKQSLALSLFVGLGVGWMSTVAASNPPAAAPEPTVSVRDIQPGTGPIAGRNDTVTVHYTGSLPDGTVFDSSHERDRPLTVTLGAGQVIPGWDMGVRGMRVGGVRELVIPPELGYGPQGVGNVIPPNATLHFEIELLGREGPPFAELDNAALADKMAEGVAIVDIRRPEEWAETGVVAGSYRFTAFDEDGRFLPSFVQEFTQTIQADQPVVLICRTGNRTNVLARALTDQAGYQQVYNVTDGITHWIAEQRTVSLNCPNPAVEPQC